MSEKVRCIAPREDGQVHFGVSHETLLKGDKGDLNKETDTRSYSG